MVKKCHTSCTRKIVHYNKLRHCAFVTFALAILYVLPACYKSFDVSTATAYQMYFAYVQPLTLSIELRVCSRLIFEFCFLLPDDAS